MTPQIYLKKIHQKNSLNQNQKRKNEEGDPEKGIKYLILIQKLVFILLKPFISSNILALEKPVEPSVFDKAITSLSPFMWNNGKSQLSLPIQLIQEPDKEWGSRKRELI